MFIYVDIIQNMRSITYRIHKYREIGFHLKGIVINILLIMFHHTAERVSKYCKYYLCAEIGYHSNIRGFKIQDSPIYFHNLLSIIFGTGSNSLRIFLDSCIGFLYDQQCN